MKKYVKIVIFAIILIVVFGVGILVGMKKNKKEDENFESDLTKSISNSSYKSENLDNALKDLDKLYEKRNKLEVELLEVKSQITVLEKDIHSTTNFEFDNYESDEDTVENRSEEIKDTNIDETTETEENEVTEEKEDIQSN